MSHKRTRADTGVDDSTFGFGRYPKRSRRELNGYTRDYHSVSVSRHQQNKLRTSNGTVVPINPSYYQHYSLSSELFHHRQSDCSSVNTQRFSTCSNSSSRRKMRNHLQHLDHRPSSKLTKEDHHEHSYHHHHHHRKYHELEVCVYVCVVGMFTTASVTKCTMWAT